MSGLTRAYFDAHADLIERSLRRHYNVSLISRASDAETCAADDVAYVVETADVRDGHAVLECGSGNGHFSRRLMDRRPGIRYVGVDVSKGQIAAAQRVNPRAEFREGSFQDLDLGDTAFDRVIFMETIGYSTNLARVIDGLLRVVTPGGRVFVKNPGQKIGDYGAYRRHTASIDGVRREYGFPDDSLGTIIDIDYVIAKFRVQGFRLELEAYPYFDEYQYNADFFTDPRICTPWRTPEKTTVLYDFNAFDPETSLTEMGRAHPEYVRYLRRLAPPGAAASPNRLSGCVVLVFQKP